MAETITIINNSGKIISTGKQLLGIFKDAKAAYHERKAHLKGPSPGIRRAQTFDVAPHQGAYPGYPPDRYDDQYYDQYDDYPLSPQHYQHQPPEPRCIEAPPSSSGRRRSVDDDGRSVASSQRSLRSHRSHRSSRTKHGDGGASEARRPPLTKSNLRTHSEVSSTAPSAVPRAYRSPYAETAPRDMMVSRPTLAHAATMPAPSQAGDAPRSMVLPVHPGPPAGGHADLYYNAPRSEASYVQAPPPQQQAVVTRPRSDPALREKKSIDMDLAYGSLPPDLESRTDLEPRQEVVAVQDPEQEARSLMERIENMLIEAECLQHSAATIIDRLQTNPEAAAAVALTLAELSALLAKLGPGFLGVVKGGAPAVFALLASPQFLIAATAAVGVTVVMFGGFKIVKRIKEGQARQALPMPAQPQAIEMGAVPGCAPAAYPASHYPADQYPPTQYARTEYEPAAHPQDRGYAPGAPGPGSHFDEALVVEEELSSIERWRRGIEIDDETIVDMELISPEALRSTIGDDAMSVRTKRTSKSHRRRDEVPDRKSSRKDREGEERSSRKERDDEKRSGRKERDGEERSSRKEREGEERSRRKHKEGRDDRSEAGSERSSRSKKSRGSVKAIEDGSREQDNTLDSVLKPKEKKTNMLKSLFKKKEREREVPVMA